MFVDRTEAGRKLAERFRDRPLMRPVVLGIPRGGVVVAAALADALNAELDVVLARKLPAPGAPEVAMGAISEDGDIFRNEELLERLAVSEEDLEAEMTEQKRLIESRKRRYRAVKPAARLKGRSVIVTDDGLATGSTMIAALQAVRHHQPGELIVAVPVASPDRWPDIVALADDAICLLAPPGFAAVGYYYDDFLPVSDDEVLALLQGAPKT